MLMTHPNKHNPAKTAKNSSITPSREQILGKLAETRYSAATF